MFEDGSHPCLLEHDFRDPDAVGIAGTAPGQVSAVGVIPTQQRGAELAHLSWRDDDCLWHEELRFYGACALHGKAEAVLLLSFPNPRQILELARSVHESSGHGWCRISR